MPATRTYAIRTGRVYTAVTVDTERHQCTVVRGGVEAATQGERLVVHGTTERHIRKAAMDGGGRSFPTLKALREAHPYAERRRDLDC